MISDSDVERARSRWDIVAADVALKRQGRELAGLCPFHGERTPSFRIVPDKGFYHCHGCGAHGSAIDYVMHTRNLSFPDAVREILGLPAQAATTKSVSNYTDPMHEPRDTAAEVAEIIAGCVEITGATAAWLYLYMRGLPTVQPGLLAHAALYCHEVRRPLPALVAPIKNRDGVTTAVQRIWLADPSLALAATATDNRAPLQNRKKTLGEMGDGSVQLFPATTRLALAEGVETAAAARRDFRLPACWAVCGVHRLGFPAHWRQHPTPKGARPVIWVPPDQPPGDVETVWSVERAPSIWIPATVRELIVFGDNGTTGQIIARHAADWYCRHGVSAIAQFPEAQFGDYADKSLEERAQW